MHQDAASPHLRRFPDRCPVGLRELPRNHGSTEDGRREDQSGGRWTTVLCFERHPPTNTLVSRKRGGVQRRVLGREHLIVCPRVVRKLKLKEQRIHIGGSSFWIRASAGLHIGRDETHPGRRRKEGGRRGCVAGESVEDYE